MKPHVTHKQTVHLKCKQPQHTVIHNRLVILIQGLDQNYKRQTNIPMIEIRNLPFLPHYHPLNKVDI